MEKYVAYNQLLDKVQQAGGYIKIDENKTPLVFVEPNIGVIAKAIFESANDSSPLKFISPDFHAWDIDDYLNAEDIEHLLNRI